MIVLEIQIPFNEPVIIIALVLGILFIGPVFFERLRIPSIAGLLICGAIIGPNGFNLLAPNLEFSLLGTMGLLYLMFLAGLEIDLLDFIENKAKSIFIGLATFIIPFTAGYLICRYLLHYELVASWLIAAMLSCHTLISYPLLGRLGIINKPIVTVVVGATIIADVLALVSMELITDFAEKDFEIDAIVTLVLRFIVLFIFVFFLIPRFSRLFLNRYEGNLGIQYIFVLVILFTSSLVAFLLKIEPILGAFFSGLVLNRLVIRSSPLFKRIEFIGNTLFIPFFLISIGILANFRVYIDEPFQLILLMVLLVTAFAGKYIAAILTRLLFRITPTETNLLFGLSVSRAASAIAIILVGFHIGVISEGVLNNTVMLILVTSISSSYITQRAGKKLLVEDEKIIQESQDSRQRILVPLANPYNMKSLLEFAGLIKQDDKTVPVYPLSIFTEKTGLRDRIRESRKTITGIIESLHSDVGFVITSRIDTNVTSGIVRASEELAANTLILGWSTGKLPFKNLFGSILRHLVEKTDRMVIVVKTPYSIREIRKIHLFCPGDAQFEKGFYLWIDTLSMLISRLQVKATVYCTSQPTVDAIRQYTSRKRISKYFELKDSKESRSEQEIPDSSTELLIFVHSRKNTVSFNKPFTQQMNYSIQHHTNSDIVIIYPERF